MGGEFKSCLSIMLFIYLFSNHAVPIGALNGFGPIALTNVQCSGTEAKLTDCQASNITLGYFTLGCSHSRDAGVQCFGQTGNFFQTNRHAT